MTQPLCSSCSRPITGTAYVCPPCTAKVAEDLGSIVDLAPHVDEAVARLVRYGGGSGSDLHPMLVDLGAAERAAAIGNAVATVARDVAESRGREIPVPDRPVGPQCRSGLGCRHESCRAVRIHHPIGVAVAAQWLSGQLEWLRHQRQGPEAFGDLRDAARELKSLVGGPLPRWYAGACYEVVEVCSHHLRPFRRCDCPPVDPAGWQRCQADLYAAPGARTVRCGECGTEHDAEHRKDWLLKEARDTLVHAELLARALAALGIEDLTPARVRGMARHGRLVAKGEDQAGRSLYRVGDVLDLVEEQERIEAERDQRRAEKAARREARQAGAA